MNKYLKKKTTKYSTRSPVLIWNEKKNRTNKTLISLSTTQFKKYRRILI